MSDQFDSFDAHTDAIIDEFQNLTSDTIGAIKSANDWLRLANAILSFYKSISGNFEGKNGFNEGTYGHRYTVYKRNMLQTSLSEVKKLFTISFEPYYSIPESPNIDGLKSLLVDIESERVSRAESAIGLTNKPKTDDLDYFYKVVNEEIVQCRKIYGLEENPTVTEVEELTIENEQVSDTVAFINNPIDKILWFKSEEQLRQLAANLLEHNLIINATEFINQFSLTQSSSICIPAAWTGTATEFAYLISSLASVGFLRRGRIPWKNIAPHFRIDGGSMNNLKQLAHEASQKETASTAIIEAIIESINPRTTPASR